jgi:putative PIN family toxin of toxin-antitoxin system
MIVVLDTNVLISALLSTDGSPAQIIEHWEAAVFDVATSGPLLDELVRALGYERVRKYLEMTPAEINSLIKGWSTTAIYMDPGIELGVVEDDPDDNRVLECAVTAEANYIVSGDAHLLDLGEYQGIEILPLAGFIVLLNL